MYDTELYSWRAHILQLTFSRIPISSKVRSRASIQCLTFILYAFPPHSSSPIPPLTTESRLIPCFLSYRISILISSNQLLTQGTTTTPKLPACPTTLLTKPSRLNPFSIASPFLIFAISYTCFKLTVPTVPLVAFPFVGLPELCFPVCPS